MVTNYLNHLYGQDLEGYIIIMQFKNGKVVKIINTEYQGLKEVVQQVKQDPDTYITPNSFYKPRRRSNNIRHYRSLYLDLDIDSNMHSKKEAYCQVCLLAEEGIIPNPTMIVDSGRGLHLYWRIEHAPMQAWYPWQKLQNYLYQKLKHLGADMQAKDAARVLRLPGSINTKNNARCKVLGINDLKYSMYDLRERYLGYTGKEQARSKQKSNRKKRSKKAVITKLKNPYALHMARSKDLIKLCDLRGYHVEGYRNKILHCYVYWQGVCIRDKSRLQEVAESLNSRFNKPLRASEVRSLVRGIKSVIDEFIDYEKSKANGQDEKISKAMKKSGGYWYTNKRLIGMLDITKQEQKHMKTIISKKEKYRRNNKRRRQNRRNENGLTSREQQKKDTINNVKELAEQGYKQVEIAQELDLTKGRISQILSKFNETALY